MGTLVAQERTDLTKGSLKKLRSAGSIPAVVYGRNVSTKSITVKNSDLLQAIKKVGRNGIISLTIDGKSKNVILRDYQNKALTGDVLHVDFLQVDENTEITTKVSVILKGTSVGEKAGGVTKQFLHELNIVAKANNLPDSIEIDITNFEMGHTIRIADLKEVYNNFTINHEDEEAVVMVDYVKQASEEEQDTPAEEA